ncbi:MAG: excinuclease ABC subunit A, partial [Deltaproteobacteria bacterium]
QHRWADGHGGAPLSDRISIRGARQHNLQSVDVDIPHDRLTVITGVSGSGKSSLAVDTLFREGQRRYLESLSSHARQLLGKLERPALDAAEGLRPALAVDQRSGVHNPRSTVGTLSEIYDYLRLLFARVGTQHCEACAGRLPQRGADRRAQVGSCPSCGATVPALTASLLSFNVPQGACPSCRGLGVEDRVDPQLLIADPERTLRQGALVPTTPNGYIVYSQVTVDVLDRVCHAHGFSVDVPSLELSDEQRNVVLNGSDRIRVPFGKHPLESRMRWTGITAKPRIEGHYQGLVPIIDEILKHKRNRNVLRFARTFPCSACDGSRLGPAARAVELAGQTISEWANDEVETLDQRVLDLELSGQDQTIAQPVLRAIRKRAELLEQLGLGHLNLSRSSESLSGGEAQRIRMATQVSSGLRGVLYVLDEPSLGLHPRDHSRLQGVLKQLRDGGNTVVSVEHDPTAMLAADWLIDIGPGPGDAGGRVLYSGPPGALLDAKVPAATARESVTRQLLHDPPTHHRPAIDHDDGPQLTIRGAAENNLQGIDVSFRLAALNVVTGVSGAGKSTLVNRILARALRRKLHGAISPPGVHTGIDGTEGLGKLISIDQAPIGRTPRSNPATYTKVFDAIRACFAKTPEAQARGLTKGHFSFNVKGGRCELCQGAGVETVGMHFLGDVAVTCSACAGRRFDETVLAVTYRDHTVLDVLRLSVVEVRRLFDDEPRIRRVLQALMDVGLGYLKLGQPATTLSGGEAQRVKLAAELGRPSKGATLYVLDEPTAGLHPADVDHLLEALRALVARGNTAIVVEHDLQVIRAADWVVDLGPEAGARGGRLVAAGSPKQVARCPQSAIGAALRGEFADQPETATRSSAGPAIQAPIALRAVTTHNLDRLDVDIPHGRLTVITGVSGSGKSSLALDTLFDACRTRFADGLPSYARHFLERGGKAELGAAQGLTPAIAIGPKPPVRNPRSTVGTMTETDAALRLLMSRAGHPKLRASMFSFNDHDGACATCRGLGTVTTCDPEGLINDPTLPLAGGAMGGSRSGRFHGDPHGRTMA